MYSPDKQSILNQYRDIVLATLDYHLTHGNKIVSKDFDSTVHLNQLKEQTQEHYKKGRLNTLKQLFRDLTEDFLEDVDLRFEAYIQEKTGYLIDLFANFHKRVQRIKEQKKIRTENEYHDVMTAVDFLSHQQPVDDTTIEELNQLLQHFESKARKKNE